jgi:DNA-binding PadR family transcriptional regulator
MSKRPGEFEQILLFALVRLEGDAHGVTIREEIELRTGRAPSPGAIYTALGRLEAGGLVSSRFGNSTPARGGRRRKYYTIEPLGAEALRESFAALRGMASGVLPKLEELAVGNTAGNGGN